MRFFSTFTDDDKGLASQFSKQLVKRGKQLEELKASKENLLKHGSPSSTYKKKLELVLIFWSKSAQDESVFSLDTSLLTIVAEPNENLKYVFIKLDSSSPPSSTKKFLIVDASGSIEEGVTQLLSLLNIDYASAEIGLAEQISTTALNSKIERLQDAHREGTLTLVCGAGISIPAGVPTWFELLDRLLSKMLERLGPEINVNSVEDSELGEIRQTSSLIVGRYLKNVLKDDFVSEVRDALYDGVAKSSPSIDAIVDLSRPTRSGSALNSIITFNFDSLLEENLETARIPCKPIYAEGTRPSSEELPIFHVHGYLPRSGPLTTEDSLVFSEDAYHDQFVEPFSWANLTQLSKFSQCTCLFVGLSMTDPNLRRLLDVA